MTQELIVRFIGINRTNYQMRVITRTTSQLRVKNSTPHFCL